MSTVSALVAAHRHGDEGSLRALAVALARVVEPVDALPTDPDALWDAVETRDPVQAGTWQEVAAARDTGVLTDAEYDYLAAAVDALTQEDQ